MHASDARVVDGIAPRLAGVAVLGRVGIREVQADERDALGSRERSVSLLAGRAEVRTMVGASLVLGGAPRDSKH